MTALADLPLLASGKVREIYDLGDALLIVASDRISTYDVVHPTPIPDKGSVLTGLSTFWFERTAEIVANHLISVTDGVPDEARGRGDGRPQARDAAGRVRRARLHHRLGLEGLPAHRRRLRDRAAGRAARVRPAARADLHAVARRPTSATTRRSTSRARSRWSAIARWPSACATCRSRSIEHAADHARERGIILADTKFEFGLDEDGKLTLGDEVCTPDSSRFWPADQYEPGTGAAELRQAVRPRLGVLDRLGPHAAGAADPRRRRRADAREVRRGIRADHRRAVRRLAARAPGPR